MFISCASSPQYYLDYIPTFWSLASITCTVNHLTAFIWIIGLLYTNVPSKYCSPAFCYHDLYWIFNFGHWSKFTEGDCKCVICRTILHVCMSVCLCVCICQTEVYSDRPNVFIPQCSAESWSLVSAPGCLSFTLCWDSRPLICKAAAHSSTNRWLPNIKYFQLDVYLCYFHKLVCVRNSRWSV